MENTNAYILKTPNIYDGAEAVAEKMKQIHPKLFGLFCPVKYELISTEKVYVPYLFLIFDYRINRSSNKGEGKKLKPFDKEGKVAVVFDMNEVHAFHYDLYDELELKEIHSEGMKGEFIKPNCTEKEAVEESVECIKWQYLRKVFHAVPELTLASKEKFYREAIKLNLKCKGKDFVKFAYEDKFGTKNEHISGLRVRLTT